MKTGDLDLLRSIGQRVSVRRQELKLTQEQLADQMDVSLQMISNLEQGRKAIRPENLIKLCRALNISSDYILTGQRSGIENTELTRKFALLTEKHQRIISQLIDSLVPESSTDSSMTQ